MALPVHMCNYYMCPPALPLEGGSFGTSHLGSSLLSSTETHLNWVNYDCIRILKATNSGARILSNKQYMFITA